MFFPSSPQVGVYLEYSLSTWVAALPLHTLIRLNYFKKKKNPNYKLGYAYESADTEIYQIIDFLSLLKVQLVA